MTHLIAAQCGRSRWCERRNPSRPLVSCVCGGRVSVEVRFAFLLNAITILTNGGRAVTGLPPDDYRYGWEFRWDGDYLNGGHRPALATT
jgi:hypothetical protein